MGGGTVTGEVDCSMLASDEMHPAVDHDRLMTGESGG